MTIRNTTADMQDPNHPDKLLLFASGMTMGAPAGFIEAQEAAGQREMVASDVLPTTILHCTEADFLALGFTFSEPDPSDPMFRPATLPPGWKREPAEHPMWSYIVDELGRHRVAVFYKAAFYDRSAHMWLEGIHAYLRDCVYYDKPVISDESWATPQEIVAEAQASIEQNRKYRANYEGSERDYDKERIAELDSEIAKYEAIIAQFGEKAEA